MGRYAPSPTGQLHLGNLRTALVTWLQVRLMGGVFVLRIDDLDKPRVKAHASERIIRDLKWLGLDWDLGPGRPNSDPLVEISFFQSERNHHYQRAFKTLLD